MLPYDAAHRLFRRTVDDRELCAWCFARERILHPEYDEMEAHHLRWGPRKQTLEAKGHRIRADGGVDVDFSTADPDPSTMRDTPPATTIDGEYKRPKPQSICKCGVVDHGNHNRSLSHLHTCLDNIIEWIERKDITALNAYPDSFDEEAAHDMLTRLRQYDTMSAKDEIALTEAVRQGFVSDQ